MLARELKMTHSRLLRELGARELAYWRGVFELENEHYDQAREKAKHDAEVAERMRSFR